MLNIVNTSPVFTHALAVILARVPRNFIFIVLIQLYYTHTRGDETWQADVRFFFSVRIKYVCTEI